MQYPEPVGELTDKIEDRSESDTDGTGEALRRARSALRYEEFIWMVQRETGLSTPGAASLAARATLATLAERLRAEADASANELISSLSSRLPQRLRQPLAEATVTTPVSAEKEAPVTDGAADPPVAEFSMTEFCRRVGWRTGVGLAEAERHARAVALALDAAVPGTEVDRVRSRLPDEYELLFA